MQNRGSIQHAFILDTPVLSNRSHTGCCEYAWQVFPKTNFSNFFLQPCVSEGCDRLAYHHRTWSHHTHKWWCALASGPVNLVIVLCHDERTDAYTRSSSVVASVARRELIWMAAWRATDAIWEAPLGAQTVKSMGSDGWRVLEEKKIIFREIILFVVWALFRRRSTWR